MLSRWGEIFAIALLWTQTITAHPTNSIDRRDASGVYYGPDTDNIYYLPVTPSGEGLSINPTIGYSLEHIGNGTYFITDGSYTTMFLVSTEGVRVVDTPPTIGYKLRIAIESVTTQPVTHFIYSHAHADHTGGVYIFRNTVKAYIAHTETLQILKRLSPPDPNGPLPNIVFDTNKTIHVGNQTLHLSYKGPNHEPGNIFIYAPFASTLMLVDVIFPGWCPFSELAQSDDIPSWIAAHYQTLTYPFQTFIGGHLNRYGNRSDVLTQKQYVHGLFTQCSAAINGGFNVTEALAPVESASPGNPWADSKTYFKVATDVCAEATNKMWVGRLAGVDAFGWENVYKMIESLRIDYGILGPFGVAPDVS